MGLAVTFVSGPRSSGKSTLIRRMIDRLFSIKPHYLRLVLAGSDKLPPKPSDKPVPECGVASADAGPLAYGIQSFEDSDVLGGVALPGHDSTSGDNSEPVWPRARRRGARRALWPEVTATTR